MVTETVSITIQGTLITLPVRLDGIEPVSNALPVFVTGYGQGALDAVPVPMYALLLLVLLFGALSVGLLTMIFLRYRVG